VTARSPCAVLVVLLVTACAAPSPTASPSVHQTASAAPTSTVTRTESPGIVNLHMITSFVGWSRRQTDGAVLHTTHGVLRWSVSTSTAHCPPSSRFGHPERSDRHHLLGERRRRSGVDQGRHHDRAGHRAAIRPPGSLDFVDRQHGWYSMGITGLGAAGSSAIFIYRTSDGGAQWSEVDQTYIAPTPAPGKLPSGCDKNPASFIDTQTGWVTASCNGGAAFFYVTHDGGLMRKPQTLRSLNSGSESQTYPPEFTSNKVGFMLGDARTPGSNALLFSTIDGGTTWNVRTTPGPAPQTLDFLDAANGWIAELRPRTGVSPLGDSQRVPHMDEYESQRESERDQS
jgi:hypothetical protein